MTDQRQITRRKRSYTIADVQRAAANYALHGIFKRTEAETGIPDSTLYEWDQGSEEWAATIGRIRNERQRQLDAEFTDIIHKALSRTRERLEIGDAKLTKAGDVRFVPVSAKDSAVIAAVCYDKRALMRGDPTSRTERLQVGERLGTLRATFTKPVQDGELVGNS
jgi:hypothetical protein